MQKYDTKQKTKNNRRERYSFTEKVRDALHLRRAMSKARKRPNSATRGGDHVEKFFASKVTVNALLLIGSTLRCLRHGLFHKAPVHSLAKPNPQRCDVPLGLLDDDAVSLKPHNKAVPCPLAKLIPNRRGDYDVEILSHPHSVLLHTSYLIKRIKV